MGRLSVSILGRVSEHELVESTLIGRHPCCHIRLQDGRISMVWVEVRHTELGWAWREFGDTGTTRGTGAVLEGGWRLLVRGARTGRVTCCDGVHVELVDDRPPAPMARSLTTGETLSGPEFEALFEIHDGVARPVGWDVEPALAGVSASDHAVVVLDGAAYQVFLPTPGAQTARGELDVSHADTRLEIDLQALTANLTLGAAELQLTGEPVRALAAYAMSRHGEHFEDGGWLTREEAHQRWVELGGKEDTPLERIAWERGKLRTALARKGARHVAALFEVRRTGRQAEVRCRFAPNCIDLR